MKGLKLFLIAVILIFFGAIFGLYYSGISKNKIASTNNSSGGGKVAGVSSTNNDDYLASLSKSLTDKGAVLYCSFQSSDCVAQKDLFKDAVKYINYVECDASGLNADADGCVGQGVESYPTWIYQEKKYVGVQTLADLAKIIDFSNK